MATLYGTNKTIERAGTSKTDPGLLGGRVRCMTDSYLITGDEAALEIIHMGKKLPKGSRVLDVILITEDLADTCTLEVGDLKDTNRYLDAKSATTAATYRFDTTSHEGEIREVTEADASNLDSQLCIKFATLAATINTGAYVSLIVFYTHD